jgi:hypothetical protein
MNAQQKKARDNARRSLWLLLWIDSNYPQKEHGNSFSRDEAREASLKAMPWEFIPDLKALVHDWWVREFNHMLKRNGFAFPKGNQGDTVVRCWMLPWDEFRELMVGKMRLAMRDRAAIRKQIELWAECNGVKINVEETMVELVHAAGVEDKIDKVAVLVS